MKNTRSAKPPEEKPDTRIHWVLVDHMCRSCGGRVLLSVANKGMTPGGNAIYRCSDCRKQSTSMAGHADICWCGQEMKHNNHLRRHYMCLPFSVLEEKPWLKHGFMSFGCDPERGGEVGVMTRSEYDRLNALAESMKAGRKVTFEFIDDAAARRFLDWWSGGFQHSGESSYLKAEQSRPVEGVRDTIRMDYSRAFPRWGYKPDVHGPDYTIQVQSTHPEGKPANA